MGPASVVLLIGGYDHVGKLVARETFHIVSRGAIGKTIHFMVYEVNFYHNLQS
jgi:hypothetical protein